MSSIECVRSYTSVSNRLSTSEVIIKKYMLIIKMMKFNGNKVLHLEIVDHSLEESNRFKNLKWSLNPLLVWAKLLGVLQLTNANGSYNKLGGSIISLIYRYLSWFITVIAHSCRLYTLLSSDAIHLFSSGTKSE